MIITRSEISMPNKKLLVEIIKIFLFAQLFFNFNIFIHESGHYVTARLLDVEASYEINSVLLNYRNQNSVLDSLYQISPENILHNPNSKEYIDYIKYKAFIDELDNSITAGGIVWSFALGIIGFSSYLIQYFKKKKNIDIFNVGKISILLSMNFVAPIPTYIGLLKKRILAGESFSMWNNDYLKVMKYYDIDQLLGLGIFTFFSVLILLFIFYLIKNMQHRLILFFTISISYILAYYIWFSNVYDYIIRYYLW